MPPHPVVTSPAGVAGEFQLLALGVTEPTDPKPVAGVGENAGGAELNVGVGTVETGSAGALLAAPAIFSCVRPNADTPNTAPMATWNKPPPCRVMGTH